MSAPQRSPLELLPPSTRQRGAALLAFLKATHGALPIELAHEEARPPRTAPTTPGGLPAVLTEALLVPGVVELSTHPGAGAMTLAARLLGELWRHAGARWLALLHEEEQGSGPVAPAVARLGVPLERLFVVAPPSAAFARIATRVVRSGAFAGVICDVVGRDSLRELPVVVRRLALAAEEARATVFLLTSMDARRGLPLPTAARAEVTTGQAGAVHIEVKRHRGGLYPRVVLPPEGELPLETFSMAPSTLPSSEGKPRRPARATLPRGELARRRRELEQSLRAGGR